MLVAAGNLSARPRIETRRSRRIERSARPHAPRRLSLMMNLFTEPAERAKAMGVFGFAAAVAADCSGQASAPAWRSTLCCWPR
jgi:hypothetical protein